MVDHEALIDELVEIHNAAAFDRLAEIFTDDYVEEYPQSHEVIRGLDNARAVRMHYPGGLGTGKAPMDRSTLHLATADEQWVMTPTFQPVRVEGSGKVGTMVYWASYADGSRWLCVGMYELRGDKIAHTRVYFAPELEPPDWRAPYRDSAAK